MKIEFRREGLQYVQLIEKNRANHFGYLDSIRKRNGGAHGLLHAAHQELKRLLTFAVNVSRETGIHLDEIELEGPDLMDVSCWGGYEAAPWNLECNAKALGHWFQNTFGTKYQFHIENFYDPEDPDLKDILKIGFSRLGVPKNGYHSNESYFPLKTKIYATASH